jgi:hypothetical protein
MSRDARFIGGFLAALAAGLALLAYSPYRSTRYAVPAPGLYVDWYQDDSIWADLTHDVSGLAESVRRADVLILGSSKTLFGLSARTLERRFADQGLRFFNLGIGGGEGARGAAQVIARLDLRNKTLMVNLDDNMLSAFVSANALAALRMDRPQAATRVASVRAKAIGDTLLDQAGLPRLRYEHAHYLLAPRNEPRAYRDMASGDAVNAIRDETRAPGRYPLPPAAPERSLRPDDLEWPYFKRALRDWQARGMQLVFFTIPYGTGDPSTNNYNPELAREAAKRLGGEYVELDWRQARSTDHLHVDRESRERLSESVADQLADPARAFAARVLGQRSRAARAD